MIKLGDKTCIPYRGDYKPVKITQGSKTIFSPITATVEGEDNIVVEHTYNDKVDMLKIYGKSVQDGTPSPDEPVDIQSVGGTMSLMGRNMLNVDGMVAGSSSSSSASSIQGLKSNGDGTYTISLTTLSTGTVVRFSEWVNLSITANTPFTISADILSDTTTSGLKVRVEDADGNQITLGTLASVLTHTRTHDIVAFQIYITNGEAEGVAITFQNMQIELGSTATDYQPYQEPSTITVPTLYSVGDVQDIMWADRAQGRAWVERHIDPDLLVDTALVDDQTDAILATPTIEELTYTALPTYPRYTAITYNGDNDVTPTIEATMKKYKE